VKLIKERAKAKFDETVEIAMNLGVDPRHADQMVRGVCNLPNGSGRTFGGGVRPRRQGRRGQGRPAPTSWARGSCSRSSTAAPIEFDRCIATPDMMPLVGRLGKVLGPRGLMPNPKVGTVSMDVAGAVKAAKGGAVEFRVEKAWYRPCRRRQGLVRRRQARREHPRLRGRGLQGEAHGAKGTYIQRIALSSTMGPA
jgi:large subunit ribosomal protein L1